MVFSSLIFLFQFIPVCFVLYYIAPTVRTKNFLLAVFSIFFYAWGEPLWVILLIFSSALDYFVSNMMTDRDPGARKAWLLVSVIINLGLLMVFKYSGFFVHNINLISPIKFVEPTFSLPIGISFYTFQTMSYTIDVYRGDVKAERSFLNFIAYVSLFPQLIAGPIVRYADIASEMSSRRPDIKNGIERFIIGLAKKVLIANYAGALVAEYLANYGEMSVFSAWAGIFFYAIQIYFDFSGYSDMAIGLGKMLGFNFLENFNYPYIAKSITEFWRRWHMSLSSFFRDYVYIPLGGNRSHHLRNLFVVWFLTGLWHGASWNFILWGLYYFVFLVVEKYLLGGALEKAPSALRHIYTIAIVLVGWAIFYFPGLTAVSGALRVMFGASGNPLIRESDIPLIAGHIVFIAVSVVACMPVAGLARKKLLEISGRNAAVTGALALGKTLFLCGVFVWTAASLVGSTFNPFLYFRF